MSIPTALSLAGRGFLSTTQAKQAYQIPFSCFRVSVFICPSTGRCSFILRLPILDSFRYLPSSEKPACG